MTEQQTVGEAFTRACATDEWWGERIDKEEQLADYRTGRIIQSIAHVLKPLILQDFRNSTIFLQSPMMGTVRLMKLNCLAIQISSDRDDEDQPEVASYEDCTYLGKRVGQSDGGILNLCIPNDTM